MGRRVLGARGGEARVPEYFRTIDDPERKDDLEGLRGLRICPEETIRLDTDEFWTPHNVKIRSTTGKKAYLQFGRGSQVDSYERLPDAYILSVSENRLSKFGNSAYRISNPNEFGRALARALKNDGVPVIGGTVAPLHYGSYKDNLTNQGQVRQAVSQLAVEWELGDYFLKPTDFKIEREWRYIFILTPDAITDDEKKVRDPALHQLCERVT